MSSSSAYYEPYEIVGPAQQITGVHQMPANRPVFVDHTKFRSVSFTAGQQLDEQSNSRRNIPYEKRSEILSNGMALPRTLMSKNPQTSILRPRAQTSPAYLVSQNSASMILPSGLQTPPLTYLDSPLWSDASPRSSITSLASLGSSALPPGLLYDYEAGMPSLNMEPYNLSKFSASDRSLSATQQAASPRLDDFVSMQKKNGIPPKLSLQLPSTKASRPLSAISASMYKTELNVKSPVLQSQPLTAPKSVRFDQVVTVARTWSSEEYDRTPIEVEPLTTNDLPELSSAIIQYVFERDGLYSHGSRGNDVTKPPLSPVPSVQKSVQYYNSHHEVNNYVPQSPVLPNFMLDKYFSSGGIISGASSPRQYGELGGPLSSPSDLSFYQNNFPALHSPSSPMKDDRFKMQQHYRGPPDSPITSPRNYAPPKGHHFSQNNQHYWSADAMHSQPRNIIPPSPNEFGRSPSRPFLVTPYQQNASDHTRNAMTYSRNSKVQRNGGMKQPDSLMSRQSDVRSQESSDLSISESDLQNDTSPKSSPTRSNSNHANSSTTSESSVPHIRELLLPLQTVKVSPGVQENVSSPVPQESQDEEAENEDTSRVPEQHRRRRRRKRTRNRKKKTEEKESAAEPINDSVGGFISIIRPEIAV